MKKGLVIGKFWPPHKGHSYLIDFALQHSDTVDVLVCDHPSYTIPAATRATWLRAMHPEASVGIIADIEHDDDSALWATHTIEHLGYAPDTVYTSEDYGPAYATYMGADHHMVDKARAHFPISARYIRQDMQKHWQFLRPEVRKDLCTRICIVGAESTGTTTLSRALADYYKAPWVPEFGRTYTEALQYMNHTWDSEEFAHIAKEQQRMEDDLAVRSNGLLICDTNAFATQLWEARYTGAVSEDVQAIYRMPPALYILTDANIPFEQDGIRDGEHIRKDMHGQFVQQLSEQTVPYILVSGDKQQRLQTAVQRIDTLLKKEIIL